MNIGTAEIIDEIEEPKPARSPGSIGPGPGGGPNDNGGGGDGPDDSDYTDDRDVFTEKKSKILTGFLLVVVSMTFGGLLAAYVVIANNKLDEWRPFDLPKALFASTLIIILSSIAYFIADRATRANDQAASRKWFIVTGGLGVAFVVSQIIAWFALSTGGMVLRGNPYAGFFYMLTAVHALHVIGGLAALGSVVYRSHNFTDDQAAIIRRQTLSQVVGWYWHFMGGLWIVLFIFLGFWK